MKTKTATIFMMISLPILLGTMPTIPEVEAKENKVKQAQTRVYANLVKHWNRIREPHDEHSRVVSMSTISSASTYCSREHFIVPVSKVIVAMIGKWTEGSVKIDHDSYRVPFEKMCKSLSSHNLSKSKTHKFMKRAIDVTNRWRNPKTLDAQRLMPKLYRLLN